MREIFNKTRNIFHKFLENKKIKDIFLFQNLANGFATMSQQNLADIAAANRMSEPRSLESEFSSGTNHR